MVDLMQQESLNEQLVKAEIKSSELEFAQKQLEDAIIKQSMQEASRQDDEDAITRVRTNCYLLS